MASLGQCTESESTSATISTAERCIRQITEFTVVRDERKTSTSGFVLEIEGEIQVRRYFGVLLCEFAEWYLQDGVRSVS